MGKLLIPIAFLLLAVTGGEIYYLFFNQPKPKPQPPQISQTSPTTISPIPPQRTSQELLNLGRSEYSQRTRLYATNSAIVSSTTTQKLEGKIIELDTKGGVEKSLGNFKYALKLVIEGKGDLPNQFYFTKNELPQLTIVQKTNSQETPIEVIDLKVGDEIILDLTIDMIKDPTTNNLVTAKITKLQK